MLEKGFRYYENSRIFKITLFPKWKLSTTINKNKLQEESVNETKLLKSTFHWEENIKMKNQRKNQI